MEQKENKMGVMPVDKLLISMSLPMMISMLVQALYNIVDSIFVSRIDENALTAVSLAFPLQTLMIALGTGTGVGINALLSKSLGEKDFEKADKTAENGVFPCFGQLCGILPDRYFLNEALLFKSDQGSTDHRVWGTIFENRVLLFLWYVCTVCV